MKTNVHWRPDWPIMREFDNNWKLQPNLEGKKYWANILKLIELEEQRLANEKEIFFRAPVRATRRSYLPGIYIPS